MENIVTNYEIKEKKVLHKGFIDVKEYTISDGETEVKREIIESPNSVSAIIYNTNTKKYIFVEQYRAGSNGIMVEVVSGEIEKSEKPEQTIKRKVMEETGYKVDYSNHITDFYISPNKMSQIISIFYCEVSEKINEGINNNTSIVEVEKLGLGGKLFFEDPSTIDMSADKENNFLPPYQLIDAKSLVSVMWLENSNTLKNMADVITQAKIRSL